MTATSTTAVSTTPTPTLVTGPDRGDGRAGRARRHRTARLASWGGLGLVALLALAGPALLPDPAAQDLGRYLEPPSLAEPLGRDEYGRSVLARLAHATRLSLVLALGCVATAVVLGTVTGVLAARLGGWVDAGLRAVSEAFVAVPALLVVLLVAAMAPAGSLVALYVGIALAQWVEYFRVVRARSSRVLGSTAVQAAGLLDLGTVHVLRRHLLPELRPLVATLAPLGLVTSVLAMSTLGFVKVGLQPPRAELGLMVTESFPFYDAAPWLCLAPVAVLFVITVSLLGLRDTEEIR